VANPQAEEGYIRIANEIWDQIMMRDFTKRQRSILDLILRLSYGCGKKYALIPTLNSFALAGVRPNHVRKEIEGLVAARVIEWDEVVMHFAFNKDYDQWEIPYAYGHDEAKLDDLITLNLTGKQRARIVPKRGTIVQTNVPETGSDISDNCSQNGKSDFPKWEVEVPKTGSRTSQNRNIDSPETPDFIGKTERLKTVITKLKTVTDIQQFVVECRKVGRDPLYEAWRQLVGLVGPGIEADLRPFITEHGMEEEVVIAAIMRGAEQKQRADEAPTTGYVAGILRNWYNSKKHTLADLKAREPPKTEEDFVAAILAKAAQAEEVFK